jgi:hypothetical protein
MAGSGKSNRWMWWAAAGVAALVIIAVSFFALPRHAALPDNTPQPAPEESPVPNSAAPSQPLQPNSLLSPPSTPEPQASAGIQVRRYPNLEAPDRVSMGQSFSLQVSLTMEPLSSAAQIQPGYGSRIDTEGRLSMTLPARPDGSPWPIDVVLTAADFDIANGRNHTRLDLPADGDSTPGVFELTPKTARTTGKVSVTFWHNGTYLARATRVIGVDTTPAPAAHGFVEEAASIRAVEKPADLTVYVHEDRAGDRTVCELTIESPYLQPGSAPCTPAEELRPWLTAQYDSIARASESARGVRVRNAAAAMSPEQSMAMLRGIGRELYRRAAGPLFDNAFWKLVDRQRSGGFQFRTIQIYTNNPSLPWELMVPVHGQRSRDGFLGTEFEIARWHINDEVTSHDRPPQQLDIRQVVAVVPTYSGGMALAHQNDEIAAIHQLRGFREVNGQLASIQNLLRDPPDGIVHFAGHGVAEQGAGGVVEYALQLDGAASLDLMSWRGMMHDEVRYHPLYFINACDVGQANRVLNFVDGWAPTVLDGGGSGFIGGLWSLSDKGAAEFAEHFYGGLRDALDRGQSASVAELVARSRREFFDSGDPTFLAYVFYGDVNLRMTSR